MDNPHSDAPRQPGLLPSCSRSDSMLPVPALSPGSEAALAAARLDSSTSAVAAPGQQNSFKPCRSAVSCSELQRSSAPSLENPPRSLPAGESHWTTQALRSTGHGTASMQMVHAKPSVGSGNARPAAISRYSPHDFSKDRTEASGLSHGQSNKELKVLAELMAASIEVRDRKRRLRKYSLCFKGRDAVQWLMGEAAEALGEAEAVDIGNAMMRIGLLHHVQFNHPFMNCGHLYRFNSVSSATEMDSSSAGVVSWHHSETGAGLPHRDNGEGLPDKEMLRLQRRAADAEAEVKVLRLADGVLYDGQLRLARRHRQISAAFLELAAAQDQSASFTNNSVLLQTVTLLLAALLLNSLSSGTEYDLQFQDSYRSAMWIPLLILVPAVPLAYAVWRSSCYTQSARPHPPPHLAARDIQGLADPLLQRRGAQRPVTAHSSSSGEESDSSSDDSGYISSRSRRAPGASARPSEGDQTSSSEDEGPPVPSAAAFQGWQDAPGLLRLKPGVGQRLTGSKDPARIPLNCPNGPIEFESEGFEGRAAIWVKGLPSSPPDLFKGKRRRSRVSVQGRFRRRTCMDDVITGQEFSRATNLPAKWLVDQVLIKLAKKINPSVEIGPMSAPSVLVPIIAMSQGVVVSCPGEEPDITGEVTEDCSLLGHHLQDANGSPVCLEKRKSYYGSAAHRKEAFFETDVVYTFHIFQHLVDLGTYELDLSLYKFDLSTYLDGQPLQFMMRERGHSGRPLFSFEMWHEKLLEAARQ